MDLTIPAERIDWRTKGVFRPGPAIDVADFVAARPNLFDGTFSWPVMTARGAAIEHNLTTLAEFCARHGVEFAPHGKTTMAPTLFAAQLRAGAWGISAATANQVLAYRAFGVPRVLLANELLDPTALRWLAGEVDAGLDFLCYVDSAAGVAAMSAALEGPFTRPLRVMVELGHPGGRTGCRTQQQVVDVARLVAAEPRLELAGVAGYEGGLPDAAAVGGFLDALRAAVVALADVGLLGEEVIVSAGGSAWFDLVTERLAVSSAGPWLPGHRLRTIIRSGAYLSHDDGLYAERTPFHGRVGDEGSLDAALRLWAQVLSVPEPGLAIAGMGKRDVSFDEGLPVPLRVRPASGVLAPAGDLRVVRLNDQHCYLAGAATDRLVPGDLVCFGISHPCTAFDKWQVIPVLDDDHTVTDVIRTYF